MGWFAATTPGRSGFMQRTEMSVQAERIGWYPKSPKLMGGQDSFMGGQDSFYRITGVH